MALTTIIGYDFAVVRVFDISELRDQILLYLDIQDLFVMQRVSSAFQESIRNNRFIKVKMMLLPATEYQNIRLANCLSKEQHEMVTVLPPIDWHGNPNSIWRHDHHFKTASLNSQLLKTVQAPLTFKTRLRFVVRSSMNYQRSSSYYKMLFSNPITVELSVIIACIKPKYVQNRNSPYFGEEVIRVKNEAGITLGDIKDAIAPELNDADTPQVVKDLVLGKQFRIWQFFYERSG